MKLAKEHIGYDLPWSTVWLQFSALSRGGEDILGLMANNMADNLLYLGVTASSLCYGFVDKDRAVETPVVAE